MRPIRAIQELGPSTADRGAGRQAGAGLRSRGSWSLIRLPRGWDGGQQVAAQAWLPSAPVAGGAIDRGPCPRPILPGILGHQLCARWGAGCQRKAAGAQAGCWGAESTEALGKVQQPCPGAFTGHSQAVWGTLCRLKGPYCEWMKPGPLVVN